MNEDMKKFREMTKPMKFRTLKMIKQSIGLTYEVGKERIKYLINYLLYKLKYLKRNTYRDIVEEHQSLPHQYTPVVLTTDDFKATVLMTLRIEKSINQDYFYREDKDGNRKITYFLKKEEIVRLFSEARLTDIHLCISGVLYDVNHLPTFKAVVLTENFEGFEPLTGNQYPIKMTPTRTVEYDTKPLRNLCTDNLLGVELRPEDITEPMQSYYYAISCNKMEDYLKKLKLSDLMIGEM